MAEPGNRLRATPLDGVMLSFLLLAISQRHGPVVCDQRHSAFEKETGATNSSVGVTGLVEALSFVVRGNVIPATAIARNRLSKRMVNVRLLT